MPPEIKSKSRRRPRPSSLPTSEMEANNSDIDGGRGDDKKDKKELKVRNSSYFGCSSS